jgi:hypothetical protein
MKNIIIFAIVAVALMVVFAAPRWKQAQRSRSLMPVLRSGMAYFVTVSARSLTHASPKEHDAESL